MKLFTVLFLAFGLVVSDLPVMAVTADSGLAMAQQRNKQQRLNLLDLIFGGALRPLRQRPKRDDSRARRVIVAPQSRSDTGRSQATAVEEVEKAENAVNVLVVGDFMASALQSGLKQTYAQNPNVLFLDLGKGLSGMVRDDVIDWPARVPELIEENRPIAVVVLVGMNDRQQMRLSAGRAEKLSDEWKSEYERRVDAIAKAVRTRSLPLFWVGLPPVKSGAMNRDYLVFNEIYRNKTEAAGGKFIDIWDGFTGAEGAFVSAGPDVNGQIVRLRNSDGINMTSSGKEKMAFYVERELRKVPGLANDAIASALPGLEVPVMPTETKYDPAGTGRTVVVSLDGPMLDGGAVLEGGPEDAAAADAQGSTSYDLVVKGIGWKPHKGRIDYDWGAPGVTIDVPVEELKRQAAE